MVVLAVLAPVLLLFGSVAKRKAVSGPTLGKALWLTCFSTGRIQPVVTPMEALWRSRANGQRSAVSGQSRTRIWRSHRHGARNILLMNHSAPSQKAASTIDPSACFQAGAPDIAISSKLGPQNAIRMSV